MLDLYKKKIVALGAHPDDIEIGCLGLLMAARLQGSQITCIIMTAGLPARTIETRRALTEALGAGTSICIYRFRDGYLRCSPKAVSHVENEVAGADLVLTMTRWDTHQDHRALEGITLSATRRQPVSILGYHAMSSTIAFRPNFLLELPPEILKRKLKAIACHQTQAHRSYMQPEFIGAWHKDRTALLLGLGPVELYHVYRLVESNVRNRGFSAAVDVRDDV